MPLISISKAAKIFDVSRPTLQKALREGMISGQKTKSGGGESWQIDTAELARVYALRHPDPGNTPDKKSGISMEREQHLSMENISTSRTFTGESVKALESVTAELERLRTELDQALADQHETQKELAAAQAIAEERKRLLDDVMKFLPPPAPAATAQRRTWWPWRRT